eukprot:6194481-Pleurochrysis_carterae.AAC.5
MQHVELPRYPFVRGDLQLCLLRGVLATTRRSDNRVHAGALERLFMTPRKHPLEQDFRRRAAHEQHSRRGELRVAERALLPRQSCCVLLRDGGWQAIPLAATRRVQTAHGGSVPRRRLPRCAGALPNCRRIGVILNHGRARDSSQHRGHQRLRVQEVANSADRRF